MRTWLSKLRFAVPGSRRPARLDAIGPATVYSARAGAYRPLRDQPTVILDTRPLMTRLARQRACTR
ncbi:hypothetical protein [Salinispora arenicola]|uniref:hypothetical protein n=1 Tax=Salinispora arenicola TaxID=168697 RepID=UPI000380FB8C|nr:hypothetical protein [Salinispora arenicola]MCN0180784.1 hypothetical protein [Salinispora arenicola]